MASGLPDYYRGIDIAYQALAELQNRPKYGAAQKIATIGNVPAGVVTTLFTLAGKGMIYGGLLWASFTSTQKDSIPYLLVDGDVFSFMSFSDLNALGQDTNYAFPIYLKKYDNVNFKYTVCFSHGVTFETGIEIWYSEGHGVSPLVMTQFFYSLV